MSVTRTETTSATAPMCLDERGVAWMDRTHAEVKEFVLEKIA